MIALFYNEIKEKVLLCEIPAVKLYSPIHDKNLWLKVCFINVKFQYVAAYLVNNYFTHDSYL